MSGAFGELAFGLGGFGGMPTTGISTALPTTTATVQTTISVLSGAQFAARMADLYPRGWCSDDAKQTGNVYSLLLSIGDQLSFVQTELDYALNAQRLQTETFPELDEASEDFFGGTLPRPAGASDAQFEADIIAGLFQPVATRSALQNALTALTGSVPRMLEPWSVYDTGAWRNLSYWNVDTVANPARWGNGGLRYQGFIETIPPSVPAIGVNNPILCWGDSAYWNVPGYFFGIISPASEDAINALINKIRAYGTVVWVKLLTTGAVSTTVAPTTVLGFSATPGGTNSIMLAWSVPAVGTPPYTYSVLYRQSGTIDFIAGPVVSSPSATVQNLAAATSYDFEIIARNTAGSSTSPVVTEETSLIPPSQALGLSATLVQSTAVTLAWSAPTTGSPPFTYSINYWVVGTTNVQNLLVGQGALTVTVIGLQPGTSYDFDVQTTNL